MDQDGHDPGWLIVEVYDDPQPAPRLEWVLSVESLAARSRIVFAIVRPRDRREDRIEMVQQPVAAAQGEVQMRASIEYDPSALWVDGALLVILHGCHDTTGWRRRDAGTVTANA